MAYKIDKDTCIGCGLCESVCPQEAITADADGKREIDPAKCVDCGMCAEQCPVDAISPAE